MIERLDAQTASGIERIGGKACGLVRLLRAGLRVPEAWCLPADAPAEDPVALRAAIVASPVADPTLRFAVRSSATAEDLAGASFAGIYDTFLGVSGVDAIATAVEACRRSLRSEAAIAYRADRGIGEDVGMAVVIQRLVASEVAGVLLTANPQRGFANEIVIDACYGLGEALVSGRTDPDHFVLERTSGAPRETRVGAKAIALRSDGAGPPREVEVPDDERGRTCLDAAQLASLHALAGAVESEIGPAMDVEWAIAEGALYVLQVRPIVGIPSANPSDIWSRKFGDEYMADYTTPSGYTFLVHWIRRHSFTEPAQGIGHAELAAMEPLRRHNGYVYFSARYACVGARAMPVERRAEAMRGWFPLRCSTGWRASPTSPATCCARSCARCANLARRWGATSSRWRRTRSASCAKSCRGSANRTRRTRTPNWRPRSMQWIASVTTTSASSVGAWASTRRSFTGCSSEACIPGWARRRTSSIRKW